MGFSAGDSLKRIQDLLTAGAISEAEAVGNELVRHAPEERRGWVYLGGIGLQTNRPALAERFAAGFLSVVQSAWASKRGGGTDR